MRVLSWPWATAWLPSSTLTWPPGRTGPSVACGQPLVATICISARVPGAASTSLTLSTLEFHEATPAAIAASQPCGPAVVVPERHHRRRTLRRHRVRRGSGLRRRSCGQGDRRGDTDCLEPSGFQHCCPFTHGGSAPRGAEGVGGRSPRTVWTQGPVADPPGAAEPMPRSQLDHAPVIQMRPETHPAGIFGPGPFAPSGRPRGPAAGHRRHRGHVPYPEGMRMRPTLSWTSAEEPPLLPPRTWSRWSRRCAVAVFWC